MERENEAFFIAAQTNVVPLAIGEPGIGKTRGIEAFAHSIGCEDVVTISLSQYEPTDVGGYPCPSDDHVKMMPVDFIHRCKKQTKALLFMDELTTCSPATQAAALRLITHAEELLPNTIVVAAANPPEIAANGYPLTPPMANRLYHHKWEFDRNRWCERMLQGFPKEEYPILPNNWKDYIPKASALIVAFMKRTDMLFKFPENEKDRGGPWPSPRSWTNASTLLAAAMSLGYESGNKVHYIQSRLMSGCVGTGADAFLQWKISLDLPDPADLLRDPKQFVCPDRNDKQIAILGSVISETLTHLNKKNVKACVEILTRAWEKASGNVIWCSQALRQKTDGVMSQQEILACFTPEFKKLVYQPGLKLMEYRNS